MTIHDIAPHLPGSRVSLGMLLWCGQEVLMSLNYRLALCPTYNEAWEVALPARTLTGTAEEIAAAVRERFGVPAVLDPDLAA